MKPLILIKHSMPEIVEGVPARAWKLSEPGRARAHRLVEYLKPYLPAVIVSSLEPKARETAQILAEDLGMNVQMVEGLHEHDRSNAPYYSGDEFQALVREFFEKPDRLVFGNETAQQVTERFRAAVAVTLSSHTDKAIGVVAHGTVISLFVSWLTGCDGYPLWQELGLPSFVVLDLESKVLLETVNLP